MATQTPKLDLDELVEGQSSAEITHNETLNILDASVSVNVLDRHLTAPPGGESDGDTYLVKATGTGDWAGHDNDIAIYLDGTGWKFFAPFEGLAIWIADENIYRIWDGTALVAVGVGANGFPSHTYFADELIFPVNADWPVTIHAPLVTDSNDARWSVLRFDDTTPEGGGIPIVAPSDALNLVLTTRGRAETAPGGVRTVGIKVYNCGLPDNAAPEAWDAGIVLDDIDIPTNEYFQYDTQIISFATLGITAGEETLLELTRIAPDAGVNLVGDWSLRSVTVEYT